MNLKHGNAIVGQSGGPTAAINATLAGVIRGAMAAECIGQIYGMKNGIEGFLENRILLLDKIFRAPDSLKLLEQTPAAALGSCRRKLPDPESHEEPDVMIYKKIFERFRTYDIRYFFYIGGNDSMDTVAKLTVYAERTGYDCRFIGVPKTIDNDLAMTDHTPGFGSAAKFVATVVSEIVRDCAVYTTKAVTIVEIMGRNAGWLTAASALGRIVNGSAPDYVYLPECVFDLNSFFADIERAFEEHPNVVIAVSEGVHYADGRYVGEESRSGKVDVFGHCRLAGVGKTLEYAVREHFGCKVRSVELSLPQRCAGHLLSKTDMDESVAIGQEAVRAAVEGGATGEMMIFERESTFPYVCNISRRDVMNIANKVRYVPEKFLCKEQNNVTDKCCEYLLPLIKGEYEIRFESGMPIHFIMDKK